MQESRQRNRLTLFHDLVEPKVIEDEASVASKTFLIRYADESVKLGNMIKIETEVDLRSLHRSQDRINSILNPGAGSANDGLSENEFYLKV